MSAPISNKQNPAKGIIALAIIVVALVFLWWWFKSGDNHAIARNLKVITIDINSGKVYAAILKVNQNYPLENPDTGNVTLWEAYVCSEEKILFPIQPKTMVTSCPECGNPKVGTATEDHKDYPVHIPPEIKK